jgi:hypothetical protein
MATVLEGCITEEHRSVMRFLLWAKVLYGKDVHKEMFPVYGGMCLSCKAGSALLENVSLMTKTLKRRFGSG